MKAVQITFDELADSELTAISGILAVIAAIQLTDVELKRVADYINQRFNEPENRQA